MVDPQANVFEIWAGLTARLRVNLDEELTDEQATTVPGSSMLTQLRVLAGACVHTSDLLEAMREKHPEAFEAFKRAATRTS